MKKSLLLTLASLLVFNAVAWGECTVSFSNQTAGTFESPVISFDYAPSKITCTIPSVSVRKWTIEESADGSSYSEIYSETIRKSETNVDKNLKATTRYIRFKNTVVNSTYSNIKIYKASVITITPESSTLEFPGTQCNTECSTKKTISVYYSAPTSGLTITSVPTGFSVDKTTIISGVSCDTKTVEVSVSFKPTIVGKYSGDIEFSNGTKVSVKGAGVLPAPTLTNTAKGYTTASLSWNSVGGATGYRLYNNGSQFGEDIASTQTSIDLTGLAMHTSYKFTITTLSGGEESNPSKEVSITTDDLAASAYINVSNASYSSVDAQWAAIPDATGYRIVSNDGVVNTFGDVTSGTLVGLKQGEKYTFTIYGTYYDDISNNGKSTENIIETLTSSCEAQNIGTIELSGTNWSNPVEITKYNATVSFSYQINADLNKKFEVARSKNGTDGWETKWTETGKSGSGSIKLDNGYKYVRFRKASTATKDAGRFTNISALQVMYLTPQVTELDLGNVVKGETATGTINVDFSAMAGNVTVKDNNTSFSVSTDKIGACGEDGCEHGTGTVTVTFTASEFGLKETTVTIGDYNVTVKANVTLPVPTLEASEITYNSAKLSWNAVDGAEKYKLNFIGGNSIETTDTWSVCDTLKLHSSNQFTVQAYGGGQYTDPSNVVTVNTLDLAAPQNFTTEEVSYTSIPTVWDAVKDATGYRIQNETLYTYEDVNAETTAYLFAALNANTTYTISVTPMYNGELSNNKASLTVTTKETPYIPVSDCEQFRDVSEKSMEAFLIGKSTDYNFGKAIYKSNVSFKAKASKAALLNTDLYAQVDGQWQKIWDESDAGISSSYKTFTAVIPDGATAVRFYNNTGSSMWRNYSELIVKKRNELTPSTELLKFGKVLIGTTETKTITLEYSNLSDMTILSEGGSVFKIEMPKTLACESGTIECKISYSPVTLDKTQQGTITLYNGLTKGIAIEGGVTPLPAANATAAATGKSAISVQWDKVAGATGYKLTCADAGINVTIPDTGSEHYSYNATGLEECTQYTFTITTMYNAIENSSANASATTYSTINIIAAGDAIGSTSWTLTGIEGKWNKTENSFEVGSNVTILASNSDESVVFDKIQYYSGESTDNPTTIPVLDGSVAQTWAGVYYRYNGVAKTDDGEVFQTLNDAVEYSKTHAVSEITLLADRTSENLDVTSGSNITIDGQGFKIGNVIVESDAKLTTSGTLIVGNLNIKTEYRNSGEVDPTDDNLQVAGTVSFDKILDPSGKVNSSMWYAVCVPFEVKVSDIRGLDEEGNEHSMVWDKDYIVDEYDGTKRAATGKGWFDLSANSILTPGKMYIVAAIKYNTWRFYKTDGSPIVSDLTSITLNEFESSNIKNQGWNAIGNSQIFHVDLNTETEFGQVLVNGKKTYDIVKLSEESFAVAAPLFIQYASGSKDVNLSMKSHSSLRSVSVENKTFNLRIAGNNSTEYADQLFLTASEYASADYVISKDLVKMGDLTGVSDARIWMKAKGANLCVMDAKLIDGVTVIPLGIYVPKSSNYEFYLNSFADGVKLELLYNGEIIHNFADGSFSTALAKGSSDSYSLKVSVDADAPVITDADEVDGVEAYITENTLYIKGLNNGAEYTVHSLQNKIASGVADGGVEQIALPAQGVYIVVSGETNIKLLNK